jgi:hypothetical protein
MNAEALQFDDAIDALYRKHDGGQDTRKGVTRASEFSDFSQIPDQDAAALLVYLDIYRGVPQGNDVFAFGPDDILAESAFDRMLKRALGTDMDEVKKIERSQGGISYGAALEKVNALLGGKSLIPKHDSTAPLSRTLAVELVADALHLSDGSGTLPYLYYVPENTVLTELELPKNTVVASPDGTLVTLTQDGVFMPLAGGYHYQGNIQLTLTERYELYRYTTEPPKPGAMPDEPSDLPPEPTWWNYFEEPYRAALFLRNGEKVPERSVDAAYQVAEDGSVTILSDDASSDAFGANHFNGIIAGGTSGKYHFKDLKIRFNGNGMDDFQGMGAGLLLCGDNTETVIENADICNYGTVRSTFVAGGSAKVMIKNSRFSAHEGIFEDSWPGGFGGKKMRNAPWMGGFEGNCRSTNLLDKAEANYYNSQIMSEKWGVLSTDNNKGCKSTAINSLIAITGGLNEKVDTSSEAAARASLAKLPFDEIYGDITRDLGGKPTSSSPHPGGYGTYSIGNTTVKFAGSTVVTADYANTCVNAAAKVIYCASTPENLQGVFGAEGLDVKPQNTVVYTDKIGVMMQRGNGGGGVTIQDGTVFHCGVSCFSVKSNGSFHIDVDNSTLISESGMILCMMDDDDLHNGIEDPASPTAQERQEAGELISEGLLNVTSATPNRDVFVHFSNMELNGDCFNASGYRGHISHADYEEKPEGPGGPGGFNPFAANPKDSARNLELRLENVRYSGALTTAEGHHIDRLDGNRWLSPVPLSKWYNIAFLECIPKKPYQAGVIVSLEKGSVWNVTRTSYLTSLTVDESSTLNGQVFVNGEATQPQPGITYTGTIIVEPGIR